MGFVAALLIALFWALLFSLLIFALPTGYGRRGEGWGIFLFFLVIIWLATWGLGGWFGPVGPVYWGVPWVWFLILAFFFTLILAASGPTSRRRPPLPPGSPGSASPAPSLGNDHEAAIIFGIYFWILLLVLIGIVVARYWLPAGHLHLVR